MKTTTIIAGILLLAIAVFFLAPAPDVSRKDQGYPWNIQTTDNHSTRVFGIELGHTSLQTFIQNVGEAGETAIFKDKDGKLSLETYFSNLNLSGFEAKIILRSAAETTQLERWVKQAGNGKPLPSGARKYLLDGEQLKVARQLPISSITYLPRVAYDEQITKQRFGEPKSREAAPDNAEYWFYPNKGLILILSPDRREVLHYVNPASFASERDKLLQFPAE